MDNSLQLVQFLEKSISATDPQEIAAFRDFLDNALINQFDAIILQLSAILNNVGFSSVVRMQAGLQLKNVLSSNDSEQKVFKQTRWLNVSAESRMAIKQNCFNALSTQEMGHVSASQCVASIACAEIPSGQWLEVIQMLVSNITTANNSESMKKASLETLGYICNEIDAGILSSQADFILTGIIYGMKEQQISVKLAATTALLNSLEFTRQNFENEQERNYIMQVVCEATQYPDAAVATVALQCLVKIMSQYYVYMEVYMQRALFAITVEAMKSVGENLKMQGIEFWSTVAEEEMELALEAEEARERGVTSTVVSKYYARGAVKHIAPILLSILEVQEEADDYDDWNAHKAAGVCLALLAQACEDNVINEVLPYVTGHIQHADWRKRDAAVMAFGSILEGPSSDSLSGIVSQAMPVIIQLLADPSAVVRDTTAWAVGRICEVLPEVALIDESLPGLLHAMVQALSGETRVATNVCWAFSSLAIGAHQVELRSCANIDGDGSEVPRSYKLSQYFSHIVQQLIETTDRPDCVHSNLRNAAYSALMELMKSAPRDCYPCVQQTTGLVLQRLHSMMQLEQQTAATLSGQDRLQLEEYQSLLCAMLQSVLRKMEPNDALAIADQIMSVLMTMFQHAQSPQAGQSSALPPRYTGVQEDALLTVSALIDATGSNFKNYLPAFMPVLDNCLQSVADYQICSTAIGILGDLARNVAPHLMQYLEPIFQLLVNTLRNPATQKSLLPLIITTFGDFAMQLEDGFEKYRPLVLDTLKQACQAQVDMNDPDMVDYLNQLRQSVVETYVGLVQGAKANSPMENIHRLNFIIADLEPIICFLEQIANELQSADELIGAGCGLVGDLATGFGQQSLQLLDKDSVHALLTRGRNTKNPTTKKYAVWASKEIKKLRSSTTTTNTTPVAGGGGCQ